MKESQLPSFLSHNRSNSSLDKISVINKKTKPNNQQKQRSFNRKPVFELPQDLNKTTYDIVEISELQRDIVGCVKESLSDIQQLRRSYSNICDDRKKYKDIVDWLKQTLGQFIVSYSKGNSQNKSLEQLHNIYSTAVFETIKQLKVQNRQKACLLKISWQSIASFYNALVKDFQKQLILQRQEISKRHKLQRQMYDKQIEQLEDNLARAASQLAKRERYFYQVVKDNRILRKRVNKLTEKVQDELETNSYLKEQNIIFYKQNQRLKLIIQSQLIQQRYRELLQKLDEIELQFQRNKKRIGKVSLQKQLKASEYKNRQIIKKQINQIIKRVNANDFLDLEMATFPLEEQTHKIFHSISVQTQPMMESIGVNTYMNISKRAVSTQFNYDKQTRILEIFNEFSFIIEPINRKKHQKNSPHNHKKSESRQSNKDLADDWKFEITDENDFKNKKIKKNSLRRQTTVQSTLRPSNFGSKPHSSTIHKQNKRNSSGGTSQIRQKKIERFSLISKAPLPQIIKQKTTGSKQIRRSTLLQPINFTKNNSEFVTTQNKNQGKKSAFQKTKISQKYLAKFIQQNDKIKSQVNQVSQSSSRRENSSQFMTNNDSSLKDLIDISLTRKAISNHDQGSILPMLKQAKSHKGKNRSSIQKSQNSSKKQSKESSPRLNKHQKSILVSPRVINNNNSSISKPSQLQIKQKQVKNNSILSNNPLYLQSSGSSNHIIKLQNKSKQYEFNQIPVKQTNTIINNTSFIKQKQNRSKTLKTQQFQSNLFNSQSKHLTKRVNKITSTLNDRSESQQKSQSPNNFKKLSQKLSFYTDTKSQRMRNSIIHTDNQVTKTKFNDKVTETSMLKMFKKINTQILNHKNNLLKNQISLEEFIQLNISHNYGLKVLTIQMRQKLMTSLLKYEGSDVSVHVFKKLIIGQQNNPLSIYYKRHIFKVYILILQFYDTYRQLQNFQALTLIFIKDLISSFFNKTKAQRIIGFFEMIEINNQYKLFTVIQNVIQAQSQSLAFMNTIYNLQSVLSCRHAITFPQLIQLYTILQTNQVKTHSKAKQLFKYCEMKTKTLPFFTMILQLNKQTQNVLINLQNNIQYQYSQIFESKTHMNLQTQLDYMKQCIPNSRYLKTLQAMQTQTVRQSQVLLYQLVKLQYRNQIINNVVQDMLGEQLWFMEIGITQLLTF